MQDIACWIQDSGCKMQMLDAGLWILDFCTHDAGARYRIKDTDTGCRMLDAQDTGCRIKDSDRNFELPVHM